MNDPSGSRWRKWDLHFHTPKSHDHKAKGLGPSDLVDRLVEAGTRVVAVTDHHILDPEFIRAMQGAGGDQLTVLPGIELTSQLGGTDGVHFIAIFAEDSRLEFLSGELMSKLELASKREKGMPEEKLYVEFPAAAEVIQNLGGIISVHGGPTKHASLEGIKNHLSFKQQVKHDLLRDHVDLIEVRQRSQTAGYLETVFPNIGIQLPIIVASDDHAETPYPTDRPCWIRADPTFAGLRMALRQPASRFCLDEMPPAEVRLAEHPTRCIKAISFARLDAMPDGEEWLDGEVPLNPGLVAIIGNKGSGKSALADSLGLLGSCSTSRSFSFLTESRFCDPRSGRARYIEATLSWHAGESRTRRLSESVESDEPERVKYLPQSFVETVCNDLGTQGGEFERELKKVVFSKVPTADKLGKRTLDELVQFSTEEIRREAESIAASLPELAEERARLAARLDPAVRSAIEKHIAQREELIQVHEATKPASVASPEEDPATAAVSKQYIGELAGLRASLDATAEEMDRCGKAVAAHQIRAAQAEKLLQKLRHLEAEIGRRRLEIEEDAEALGLHAPDLVKVAVDLVPVEEIRDKALAARDAERDRLGAELPEGLKAKERHLRAQIAAVQEKLNRPNQEYQVYLEQSQKWEATLKRLVGDEQTAGSLTGLRADLASLDGVPARLDELDGELEQVAEKIYALRVQEAEVYEKLYGPVREFVADPPLPQSELEIDFRVELVQVGFAEVLLSYINQQKVGSFAGLDDGRARATRLAASVTWTEWNEVRAFLRQVMLDLHADLRPESNGQSVLIHNLMVKGRSAANLYSWLFGLSYLKPRYILESDGKRLEQLSPGERGTLLLVFYLLVDGSEDPLIIDQPEANLDNATVAKKLVACIQYAKERRQVVIVTHNPNLAVFCDADQVIYASIDHSVGHKISYETGALESPTINRRTIDVLEGGRVPFDVRDDTYLVCDQ
jgi:predicted metal-dependent phosphoesterase TrpH